MKKFFIKHGLWIFIGIVLITLLYGIAMNQLFTNDSESFNRGIFGDSFGALTALFSGLGFAGLVYTILLQREQIDLQQAEINDTKAALNEDKKQRRIDSFDERFFKMLSFNNELADRTDRRSEVLPHGYFNHCIVRLSGFHKGSTNPAETLKKYFTTTEQDFEHYFRNTIGILDHIHHFREMEVFYTNLLTAQMSIHQLMLLFYYAKYLEVLTALGKNTAVQWNELRTIKIAAHYHNLFEGLQRTGIELINESEILWLKSMIQDYEENKYGLY